MSAEHTKSPEEIIQSWIVEAEPKHLIKNKFVKQLLEALREIKRNAGPSYDPDFDNDAFIAEEALKPWEVENG